MIKKLKLSVDLRSFDSRQALEAEIFERLVDAGCPTDEAAKLAPEMADAADAQRLMGEANDQLTDALKGLSADLIIVSARVDCLRRQWWALYFAVLSALMLSILPTAYAVLFK